LQHIFTNLNEMFKELYYAFELNDTLQFLLNDKYNYNKETVLIKANELTSKFHNSLIIYQKISK
jgi:hypothetical protein